MSKQVYQGANFCQCTNDLMMTNDEYSKTIGKTIISNNLCITTVQIAALIQVNP